VAVVLEQGPILGLDGQTYVGGIRGKDNVADGNCVGEVVASNAPAVDILDVKGVLQLQVEGGRLMIVEGAARAAALLADARNSIRRGDPNIAAARVELEGELLRRGADSEVEPVGLAGTARLG
jgi:hypothetical protein